MLANEYSVGAPPVDENTLVIAVSQSGETADTLNALRQASAEGAATLTVTNVVGSTAARVADETLFIRAGPEIGVAATKTFSSQAVMLVLLAQRIADDVRGGPGADLESLLTELSRMPAAIDDLLSSTNARSIARRYEGCQSYFFIGRGLGFPVALEGALKFKEITYDHAEGFASGELKHRPLALVTPETPVFAVFTGTEDEDVEKRRGRPGAGDRRLSRRPSSGRRRGRTPRDPRHRQYARRVVRERTAPARLLSRGAPARATDRQAENLAKASLSSNRFVVAARIEYESSRPEGPKATP